MYASYMLFLLNQVSIFVSVTSLCLYNKGIESKGNNNDALTVEAPETASCADGVCAIIDKDNNLVTVDETFMKKRDLQLKTLADRVVNLRGMIDQIRF